MAKTTILYDRDCGLCRTVMGAVLVADRSERLRPVALQDPEALDLLPGLSEEKRMASFHVVAPDGAVRSAGPALADMLAVLPGGRALARGAALRPALTERGYHLLADNRSRLGHLIPAAIKRRATDAIDRRSEQSRPTA